MLESRQHPFRLRCLQLLDRDVKPRWDGSYRLRKEGWEISFFAGYLDFRNITKLGDENEIIVWNDQRGGQRVDDLRPYEHMLNRWMVLESLADA